MVTFSTLSNGEIHLSSQLIENAGLSQVFLNKLNRDTVVAENTMGMNQIDDESKKALLSWGESIGLRIRCGIASLLQIHSYLQNEVEVVDEPKIVGVIQVL